MRIDTAAGADVVDGTATPGWGAQAVLGEGADRFHGGPTSDQVNAGTGQPTSTSGSLTGRDDPARPGVLALDLGGGDDVFSSDAPGAPGSTYAGGPGRDNLTIGSRDQRLALELRTARLDVGGVVS
ncbi:hypothetical protein, partial [uncultured Nocardioides sp.]|uniref:hypothetical protein n=1 Tax=uncultured Nocardioides sp. TaxID=198441 RepID=UPI0025ECD79B